MANESMTLFNSVFSVIGVIATVFLAVFAGLTYKRQRKNEIENTQEKSKSSSDKGLIPKRFSLYFGVFLLILAIVLFIVLGLKYNDLKPIGNEFINTAENIFFAFWFFMISIFLFVTYIVDCNRAAIFKIASKLDLNPVKKFDVIEIGNDVDGAVAVLNSKLAEHEERAIAMRNAIEKLQEIAKK